jgi:hypothetical protein
MVKCIHCVHSCSDERKIDNPYCTLRLLGTRSLSWSFIFLAANVCLTLFAGNLPAQQPAIIPVFPAGDGLISPTSATKQNDASTSSSLAYDASVSSKDDLHDNPTQQNPNPTRKHASLKPSVSSASFPIFVQSVLTKGFLPKRPRRSSWLPPKTRSTILPW